MRCLINVNLLALYACVLSDTYGCNFVAVVLFRICFNARYNNVTLWSVNNTEKNLGCIIQHMKL